MIQNVPSIYNGESIYNGGGGGGGGGNVELNGVVYTVRNIGYNTEFIEQPLLFIPNNKNNGNRAALLTHLYFNGYDIDYIDSYFSNPDGWRVPNYNDLVHLKQYLNSNNLHIYNNPEWDNPKWYIGTNGVLVEGTAVYIWSKINNNVTNLLTDDGVNSIDVVQNTAPYNGAKYLLYLCRDSQ